MLKEVTEKYSRELDGFIRELRKTLSHSEVAEDAERLLKYVEDEFFGSELAGRVEYWEICDMVRAVYLRLRSKYGILQEYLEDPAINEIMVNGPEHIFVEKNRKVQAVDNAFISAEELEGVIRMLASDVHREINEANPIVDARMPSGYRINGVLRNVALNGPSLTIRKFAESMITMEELDGGVQGGPVCADGVRIQYFYQRRNLLGQNHHAQCAGILHSSGGAGGDH